MCMTPEDLIATDDVDLLKFYKRAIEMKGQKGPHDERENS